MWIEADQAPSSKPLDIWLEHKTDSEKSFRSPNCFLINGHWSLCENPGGTTLSMWAAKLFPGHIVTHYMLPPESPKTKGDKS